MSLTAPKLLTAAPLDASCPTMVVQKQSRRARSAPLRACRGVEAYRGVSDLAVEHALACLLSVCVEPLGAGAPPAPFPPPLCHAHNCLQSALLLVVRTSH